MTVNTSLPAGDLIDKKNYFPWNGYAHHNKRQPMNEIIRSEGFFIAVSNSRTILVHEPAGNSILGSFYCLHLKTNRIKELYKISNL